MFGKKRSKGDREAGGQKLSCSFCKKTQDAVRKLIAGPTVFICDECVQVCVDIIADDARASAGRDDTPEAAEARARAAAERLNRDPVVDPSLVPAWHIRCPLCEVIVPTEGAIPILGRGVLCRLCVDAIQATTINVAES
jgi:hypothetical protein